MSAAMDAAVETLTLGQARALVKIQREEIADLKFKYAGAVGLLCDLSVQIRPSLERREQLDLVETAARDWATTAGPNWIVRRFIHAISVELVVQKVHNEGASP